MALKKKKKNRSVVVDEYENAYSDSYSEDNYENTYDSGDSYNDDSYDGGYITESGTSRGKKGSGALGTILGVIVVIALIAGIFLAVTAVLGPTKGQCKDTIETAEYALNNTDVYSFCDVIEPSVGRKIKAGIMLVSAISSEDATQYLVGGINQLGSAFLPTDGTDATEFLKNVKFEPYSYGLPGKTRTVKCNVQINGSTYAKVKMIMKKSEGQVYISKISAIS